MKRTIYALCAASTLALATPVAAQVYDSNGDSNLYTFGGTQPGTSATLTLTLDTFNALTGVYNFSYTLTNTSNTTLNPSGRITAFGFNDSTNLTPTGSTGSGNLLDEILFGANISGGNNEMDICLTTNNCSGGGSGGDGVVVGSPVSGTFSLDYPGSLSSLTLSGFTVRYQSTGANGEGSGIGTVTPPIPEPATWAMMLLGFAGIGMTIRRRRSGQVLAQVA